MVTFFAVSAKAGISVIAVAPDPITTMFLSVQSKSSGQNWGWIFWPLKFSIPGISALKAWW